LITCSAPAAPWWHFSVGICIGIAGGLGIIVPLLREQMGRREKLIWSFVIVCLTVLELRMIILSDRDARNESDYAQCLQLQQFQAVQNESQRQFQATMGQAKKVFNEAGQAANTASEAVDKAKAAIDAAVGSGDSYCLADTGPPPVTEVSLGKRGQAPLYGVTVTFWLFDYNTGTEGPLLDNLGRTGVYDLGDIAAGPQPGCLSSDEQLSGIFHHLAFFPAGGVGAFQFFPDRLDVHAQFNARRGEWDQEIHYRKINGKWVSATVAFTVDTIGTVDELCGNAEHDFPTKGFKWLYNTFNFQKSPLYVLKQGSEKPFPRYHETQTEFSCAGNTIILFPRSKPKPHQP
jgi:hypothetical protein